MVCVVRYSFLLINICLRSSSWANPMVQVTPLIRAAGNEIIIQCATDKTPQDGVYMYKLEGANKNKQELFYYYKDNTFTTKSTEYKAKVRVDGKIPNLNVTISNVQGCWGHKKYRPSNQPSDSVYEEMKRSNVDCPSSVRTFINPDYQSTKLLR
ncbi:hypothetical protein cypCar_00042038 [Cyprinus carpio]|nr:hypothetical protein cypCar_00042038 [Cyprinus carpio]